MCLEWSYSGKRIFSALSEQEEIRDGDGRPEPQTLPDKTEFHAARDIRCTGEVADTKGKSEKLGKREVRIGW